MDKIQDGHIEFLVDYRNMSLDISLSLWDCEKVYDVAPKGFFSHLDIFPFTNSQEN